MDNVLGLLGFCLFVAAVIGFAAGISWLVVKLTPKPSAGKPDSPSPPST